MLSRIREAFEKAVGPLDLNELSHRLGVEQSALDGMLEFLVRKGKLREIGLATEACTHCGSRLSCAQSATTTPMGKAYELAK
ncbi:hypothetical protein KAU37_03835 [Candidatus Bipolaricaulota bacterium]|nr:hypothetical protein [Candidatus Bipolaricaulota bacterium]